MVSDQVKQGHGQLYIEDHHSSSSSSTSSLNSLVSRGSKDSSSRSSRSGSSLDPYSHSSSSSKLKKNQKAQSKPRIQISDIDKQITTIQFFYSEKVHGLRFHFKDGSTELFGHEDGLWQAFQLSPGEQLMGCRLSVSSKTLKLSGVELRTSFGRYSKCFGEFDGDQVDICFNGYLKKLSGVVDEAGIVGIRFHW
ncbi:unnamed protein product [Ambrosiozyma monospora]|uniref:Unnamed protein product n=1 Tax=Ambrosiozyma monospora TaxID=43982 RepID=A0A9W6T9Q6_AMBMO|nr:unnamed protein product [Ambrosiozyma monospora]